MSTTKPNATTVDELREQVITGHAQIAAAVEALRKQVADHDAKHCAPCRQAAQNSAAHAMFLRLSEREAADRAIRDAELRALAESRPRIKVRPNGRGSVVIQDLVPRGTPSIMVDSARKLGPSHATYLVDEWKSLVMANPRVAAFIASGELVVEPLSLDETVVVERGTR